MKHSPVFKIEEHLVGIPVQQTAEDARGARTVFGKEVALANVLGAFSPC